MHVFIKVAFVTLLIFSILADDSCGSGNSQNTNSPTPADTLSPTTASSCQPKWVYDQIIKQGQALVVVDPEADHNGTSYSFRTSSLYEGLSTI